MFFSSKLIKFGLNEKYSINNENKVFIKNKKNKISSDSNNKTNRENKDSLKSESVANLRAKAKEHSEKLMNDCALTNNEKKTKQNNKSKIEPNSNE